LLLFTDLPCLILLIGAIIVSGFYTKQTRIITLRQRAHFANTTRKNNIDDIEAKTTTYYGRYFTSQTKKHELDVGSVSKETRHFIPNSLRGNDNTAVVKRNRACEHKISLPFSQQN